MNSIFKARKWKFVMPRHRPSNNDWRDIRQKVWLRDKKKCQHCGQILELHTCHIDHIKSGKSAGNRLCELRTLCRRCHITRIDYRHRGMIASALRDGIIPVHWRELLWEGWYMLRQGTAWHGTAQCGMTGWGKARKEKMGSLGYKDSHLFFSYRYWTNVHQFGFRHAEIFAI